MVAFVVQAPGEFGDFVGPHFFNEKAPAEQYAKDLNAALKPGVPQFKVGKVEW